MSEDLKKLTEFRDRVLANPDDVTMRELFEYTLLVTQEIRLAWPQNNDIIAKADELERSVRKELGEITAQGGAG